MIGRPQSDLPDLLLSRFSTNASTVHPLVSARAKTSSASSPVPRMYSRRIWRSITAALRQALTTRYEAELVAVPFTWYPKEELLIHAAASRLIGPPSTGTFSRNGRSDKTRQVNFSRTWRRMSPDPPLNLDSERVNATWDQS